MRFDVVSLTCRMKSAFITAMFNIGTGGENNGYAKFGGRGQIKWNNLPCSIRESGSLNQFKRLLYHNF